MWNEAAEAQFDVLSQYLYGERKIAKSSDCSPVSSLRLEPGTSRIRSRSVIHLTATFGGKLMINASNRNRE